MKKKRGGGTKKYCNRRYRGTENIIIEGTEVETKRHESCSELALLSLKNGQERTRGCNVQ